MRLTVRMRAVGTAESTPIVERIASEGARLLGSSYELVPTGALYHVIRDSNHLVAQQIRSFATAIAMVVVFVELWAIAWVQNRYMETPFWRAAVQVVVGGLLVFATGILIGSA